MRIGIVPCLSGGGGGIYQYSTTMLHALDECGRDGADAFVAFVSEPGHPLISALEGNGWEVQPMQSPAQRRLDHLRKLVGEGPHRYAWRWLRRRTRRQPAIPIGKHTPADLEVIRPHPRLKAWFTQCKIELMLYPTAAEISFETGVPYVMAIHDLQHRLQPEFPEVSANSEWEYREYCFRHGSRNATLLLADSEVGKEDILNCYGQYGVTACRVKVLPYLPASYLAVDVPQSDRERVQRQYQLPDRYFFYPAQFWPHKNHARIVHALGLLKKEQGLEMPILFCGAHCGEIREQAFSEVQSLAHTLGVEGQIRYLGYVPDQDMSALYSQAVALVMPTFFGPTNIPPMEAWSFGCPVLTSDIRGIREHSGDAALLVNPRSAEAIADGLHRLWTDANLRRDLAERGRVRLAQYTPEDFRSRLIDILNEAKARVRCSKGATWN